MAAATANRPTHGEHQGLCAFEGGIVHPGLAVDRSGDGLGGSPPPGRGCQCLEGMEPGGHTFGCSAGYETLPGRRLGGEAQLNFFLWRDRLDASALLLRDPGSTDSHIPVFGSMDQFTSCRDSSR